MILKMKRKDKKTKKAKEELNNIKKIEINNLKIYFYINYKKI